LRIRLFAFVTLALVVGGCSTTKAPTFVTPDLPAGFPNHTPSEIVSNIAIASEGLDSLKSKSRIRFDTPERRGSVNLNIAYRKSDSLFASVRITFGIEAARVLITPDSFFVYQRVGKKLYFGEAEMIKVFFPTPAPMDELFPSLTGTIIPDQSAEWQVRADSSYYYLVSGDGRQTYTVDPRIWRVVNMEARSAGGQVVETRTFSDFDWFGSSILPRRLEATRPMDGQKVWVYHRSIEVNPPELSLTFKTGKISERILVRQRTSDSILIWARPRSDRRYMIEHDPMTDQGQRADQGPRINRGPRIDFGPQIDVGPHIDFGPHIDRGPRF